MTPRGRVAALARDRSPDDPELIQARRDLAASPLETYVIKLIANFPPLTQEQRDTIAAALRPARRGTRANAVDRTTQDRGRDGGDRAA